MWFRRKHKPAISEAFREPQRETEEVRAGLTRLQLQIDELEATAADINSKLAVIKELGEERDAIALLGGTDVQVSEIRN